MYAIIATSYQTMQIIIRTTIEAIVLIAKTIEIETKTEIIIEIYLMSWQKSFRYLIQSLYIYKAIQLLRLSSKSNLACLI